MTPATTDRSTPLLKQRIRALFRRLPRALGGDEEALHQMRVAGRRLRMALPLLARHPDGHRVSRALKVLREITRTGGANRDLDVAVRLFDARLKEAPPGPDAVVLRRHLRGARGRSRARLAEALMDVEIARLRRDLRAIVRGRGDSLFTAFRRLRELRDAQGAETLALLHALGTRFDPTELHRLRRRIRRLRYAAEVGESLKDQPSPAVAEFRALQDELGRLHDNFVLSQWFGRQAASARLRRLAPLAREAAARQAYYLEKSRTHHRAFLELAPGEVVERGLRAMGQSRSAA